MPEKKEPSLLLNNTLTGEKAIFKPRQGRRVKMFSCGPSIYRRPHLGNFRTYVYQDILERYLEYRGYEVDRLINYTDIEDKSIEEAVKKHKDVLKLTDNNAKYFEKECSKLYIRLPGTIPRSSNTIEHAVIIIKKLVRNGSAYRYKNNIYFDPLTYDGFGKLYGLNMDRWPKKKKRFHKDTYPGQHWNLGDFILWHGSNDKDDVISWDTEIGRGRPSWNIQDPAAITKYHGLQIDIFCGGIDNLYRHHDYNLAVMESFSGKEFARYWLHGEHLLIDGEKMSKSKGNIVYTEDLLGKGFSPTQIRFFLMYGHYRKKKNLTMKNLEKLQTRLDQLHNNINKILQGPVRNDGTRYTGKEHDSAQELLSCFENAMNDDMNIKKAYDDFERIISKLAGKSMGKDERKEIRSAIQRINSIFNILLI